MTSRSMKKLHLIFFTALMLTFVSCKKSQLKQPTDVSVKMDINRSSSTQGHLSFDAGYIRLASFGVSGVRQEGGPVDLETEFPGGKIINFSPTLTIADLALEIPQGNYTSLEIEMDTHEGDDEPTIEVSGTYTNQSSQSIPIIFQFMSSETFSVSGEADDGDPIIMLDKDTPATSFIVFNPIYWFDIVTINALENANLVDVQGTMTILINDETNESIYDIMADRVDEQTEATFSN